MKRALLTEDRPPEPRIGRQHEMPQCLSERPFVVDGCILGAWRHRDDSLDCRRPHRFETGPAGLEIRRLGHARNRPGVHPGVVGSGGSSADEIARLADLRDKAVLTEAEFPQGKAKALGAPA
jgi:hypothetical protein